MASDAELKGYIDVWTHHNLLMWSRLRDMLLLQVAFFGAGYSLRSLGIHTLIFIPFLVAGLGTLLLMHFSHVDRATRNRAERNLKALNFKIRLDLDDPNDREEYNIIARRMFAWIGATLYMDTMFYFAIIFDAAAAYLLTTM